MVSLWWRKKNKYLMKLITNEIKDIKKKIDLFPVEKYGIDGDVLHVVECSDS